MKKASKKDDQVNLREMLRLQEELEQTRKQYGIEKKEGRLSCLISGYFDRKASRPKVPVNRKKYLLLAGFTGWFGGHRFYAKQYAAALIYLLFFWSGFPLAMTIIDILAAIPAKTDENGMIYL